MTWWIGSVSGASVDERCGTTAIISTMALRQSILTKMGQTENRNGQGAIEAVGLTRRFGDFVAVDHVSFSIGRGEIFGFLGSNGCGKTTTMKMLTGLLPVTEGSAKLFGKPMGADDMEARRNVGYMSQAFSYSELTVRQNLDLHARLYHLPANQVEGRIKELLVVLMPVSPYQNTRLSRYNAVSPELGSGYAATRVHIASLRHGSSVADRGACAARTPAHGRGVAVQSKGY